MATCEYTNEEWIAGLAMVELSAGARIIMPVDKPKDDQPMEYAPIKTKARRGRSSAFERSPKSVSPQPTAVQSTGCQYLAMTYCIVSPVVSDKVKPTPVLQNGQGFTLPKNGEIGFNYGKQIGVPSAPPPAFPASTDKDAVAFGMSHLPSRERPLKPVDEPEDDQPIEYTPVKKKVRRGSGKKRASSNAPSKRPAISTVKQPSKPVSPQPTIGQCNTCQYVAMSYCIVSPAASDKDKTSSVLQKGQRFILPKRGEIGLSDGKQIGVPRAPPLAFPASINNADVVDDDKENIRPANISNEQRTNWINSVIF